MKKIIIILGYIFTLGFVACSDDDSETKTITPENENIESTDDLAFTRVPNSYNQKITQAGTIETLTYYTETSGGDTFGKTANVYLTYQNDSNQQYEILYLSMVLKEAALHLWEMQITVFHLNMFSII
ncbi:hypothetical protein [Chondrinema litorale]|uniref:hypothetical protein n=1 Tax=Chondrinema litorale TaxID=2994555 RepID=UPI0025429784|nr:hypothetical protein [Chondrinema litorale]UZR96819.1 hypothetical protein OQ292_24290 [Chondrinema litorale]